MHTQEILTIISLIIASIAIGLSYFTFQKQRSVNNEDLIFQQKVKIYQQYISRISRILKRYDDVEAKWQDHKAGITLLSVEQLEDMEEDLDKEGYLFTHSQFKDHLLLSSEISKKMEGFHNLLLLTPVDLEGDFPAFKNHLNRLYTEADNLLEAFRKDLKIEKLNYSLFKRISGKR